MNQFLALLLSLTFAAAAAAQTSDPAPLTAVSLDTQATATDATGRTLSGAQAARLLPGPGDEAGAAIKTFAYGDVTVVRVDRDRLRRLRIWARRPEGWRLLVQHDVMLRDAPPTTTPSTGKECDNPCKSIPYSPKSDAERGVIAAYQALETSAHGADASTWGTHVADEFVLVSSNADRTFDKPTRLAAVGRASFGGVMPTRFLSGDMLEFGDVVVMRSQHAPETGNRLQITRVWVRRGGVWQSTLSYQTIIQQ